MRTQRGIVPLQPGGLCWCLGLGGGGGASSGSPCQGRGPVLPDDAHNVGRWLRLFPFQCISDMLPACPPSLGVVRPCHCPTHASCHLEERLLREGSQIKRTRWVLGKVKSGDINDGDSHWSGAEPPLSSGCDMPFIASKASRCHCPQHLHVVVRCALGCPVPLPLGCRPLALICCGSVGLTGWIRFGGHPGKRRDGHGLLHGEMSRDGGNGSG